MCGLGGVPVFVVRVGVGEVDVMEVVFVVVEVGGGGEVVGIV